MYNSISKIKVDIHRSLMHPPREQTNIGICAPRNHSTAIESFFAANNNNDKSRGGNFRRGTV